MLCEKCHAPSSPGETVCSKCGAPLPQNIEGFEKTAEIQQRLKKLIDREGARIILSEDKFKALLIDFIPDYEKERKLLVNMCDAGILKNMITEGNRETAIMKARSSMQGEMFLSENAAEFVIACFTYLLGWPFEANLRIKEPEELEKEKTFPFQAPTLSQKGQRREFTLRCPWQVHLKGNQKAVSSRLMPSMVRLK